MTGRAGGVSMGTEEAGHYLHQTEPIIHTKELSKYIVNVDDVKAQTGFDLLSEIDTQVQQFVESNHRVGCGFEFLKDAQGRHICVVYRYLSDGP